MPSHVPMGGSRGVEDVNPSIGEIGRHDVSNFQSICEFQFDEHEVQLSADHADLLEPASVQVCDAFRQRGCDIGENALRSIAAVQVECRAAKMWETLRHCFQKFVGEDIGDIGYSDTTWIHFCFAKYGPGYEGVDVYREI